MNNNDYLIESIDHKGYKINVYQDIDSDWSPDENDDDQLFLVHYHRDFDVRKDEIITKEDCENWNSGEKIEQEKDYYIFLTKAYIHSEVVLALDDSGRQFPDEQWDVSHCGCVLVSKKEVKTRKQAYKLADGLIKDWNYSLSGDIAGYMIEDSEDEEFGGCWGFIGYSDYRDQLIEEAKGEIETEIEEKEKEEKAKIDNYNELLKRFSDSKKDLLDYIDRYYTDKTLKDSINRNLNSIKSIITKKI